MLLTYGHTEERGSRKIQSASAESSSSSQRDQGTCGAFFSDRPVIKGTVYELKRRCGKPGCKCARGELHRRMVLSASEGGKTRLRVIPRRFLVEVEAKVRRYQELRQVRARLGEIYRKMVRVIDEMEAMRREELPSSDKDRIGSGDLRAK
jgi:hypothetical protein